MLPSTQFPTEVEGSLEEIVRDGVRDVVEIAPEEQGVSGSVIAEDSLDADALVTTSSCGEGTSSSRAVTLERCARRPRSQDTTAASSASGPSST